MHCKNKYFSRLVLLVNVYAKHKEIFLISIIDLNCLMMLRSKNISMENNIFLYLYTNAQMTDLD